MTTGATKMRRNAKAFPPGTRVTSGRAARNTSDTAVIAISPTRTGRRGICLFRLALPVRPFDRLHLLLRGLVLHRAEPGRQLLELGVGSAELLHVELAVQLLFLLKKRDDPVRVSVHADAGQIRRLVARFRRLARHRLLRDSLSFDGMAGVAFVL